MALNAAFGNFGSPATLFWFNCVSIESHVSQRMQIYSKQIHTVSLKGKVGRAKMADCSFKFVVCCDLWLCWGGSSYWSQGSLGLQGLHRYSRSSSPHVAGLLKDDLGVRDTGETSPLRSPGQSDCTGSHERGQSWMSLSSPVVSKSPCSSFHRDILII